MPGDGKGARRFGKGGMDDRKGKGKGRGADPPAARRPPPPRSSYPDLPPCTPSPQSARCAHAMGWVGLRPAPLPPRLEAVETVAAACAPRRVVAAPTVFACALFGGLRAPPTAAGAAFGCKGGPASGLAPVAASDDVGDAMFCGDSMGCGDAMFFGDAVSCGDDMGCGDAGGRGRLRRFRGPRRRHGLWLAAASPRAVATS